VTHVGSVRSLLILAGLVAAATASAQFGHPLKGSWSGDWGPSATSRARVLLEIDWDGKTLSGTINPGPNAIVLDKVDLDPATWGVRLEANGKDAAGNAVRYLIEGKLENIGAYQRFITGTWTQGSVKGDFRVTRN
jgi:hypothetical protein